MLKGLKSGLVAAVLLMALFAPLAAMCVPPAPPAHDCCPTEQPTTAPAGNCCIVGAPQRPQPLGSSVTIWSVLEAAPIHQHSALVSVAALHFAAPAAPDTSPPGCNSVLRI